jgi:hypothetical protein
MDTFKELYCAEQQIAPRDYANVVLRRCLRLPARLVYWPSRLLFLDLFSAELDLVNNVGRLTTPFDLDLDVTEYRYHPFNQNQLRRSLGLAISTGQLRRLVFAIFNADSHRSHSRKRSIPKSVPPSNIVTGPSHLIDISRLG